MSDPKFIYHIEIVEHTHSIFISVTIIQLIQPCARIATTSFRTIPGFTFSELIAVSDTARAAEF